MKLTRRQLVIAAAGSAVAANASGQTAPAQDLAKQARDKAQSNADTLAKFEIPMSTEPAFQFKP